jgi:hypothetical protein
MQREGVARFQLPSGHRGILSVQLNTQIQAT